MGREQVEKLIYRDLPKEPLTFTNYPRDPQWLLDLREAVAREIEENLPA